MKLISSFWTVMIISVAVCLIILSYGFFHEYKPNMTQAKYDEDFAQALQDQGNKLNGAKKRKEKAIELVKEKTQAWNNYVETKTPPDNLRAGGIDISANPYKLSMDTWTFRDSVQRALNHQLKAGGVKLLTDGPVIPTPTDIDNAGGILSSFYNYPGIKFPVLIYDLGQIQVQGTYKQIMDHVRAYKTMPNYLAMADGLRLEGTSPLLTGTYNLSLVAFIRGKKVYSSLPEDTSASSGGSGRSGGFGGGAGGPGARFGGGRGFGAGGGPSAAGGGGPRRGGPRGGGGD
jgi:hypothetical protein